MNTNLNIEILKNKILKEMLNHKNENNEIIMPRYVAHAICMKLKIEPKILEENIEILKKEKIIENTIIETYGESKLTTYIIKELN